MTKEQFLQKLSDKLIILSEEERNDMITEYRTHIDMKIAEGMLESEVIAGFGDIDELAAELLSAYHVDPNYDQRNDRSIENLFKRVGRFFQASMESLLEMDRSQVTHLLGRFVVLGLIFFAMMIVLAVFEGLIENFFWLDGRYEGVGAFFRAVIDFVFGMIRFVIFLYFAYFFFDHYVIDKSHEPASFKQIKKKIVLNDDGVAIARPARVTKERSKEGDERLMRFFYFLIKLFIVLFFLLPLVSAALGTLVAGVVTLGMGVIGWPLWGVTMILIGATLVMGVLLFALWNVLFREGGREQ